MTDFFDVTAIGVRVRVTSDGVPAETIERVRASWVDAVVPAQAEADATVVADPAREADSLAQRLTVDVTLAALKHRRGELLMFHAAGVADSQGRVAAFVGPSGRGKTTLSGALGRQYGYVSDETVGADLDGRVLPYRKPLSVVREGAPKQQIAPSEFGMLPVGEHPLRLDAIAVLDRDATVEEPVIEAVAFCDAVAEIVPQMSYFAELPTPLQTLAAVVDRIGGLTRVRYSDAESVTPLVPKLLAHRAAPEVWHPVPPPASLELLGGGYWAPNVVDAVRFGDRTALLTRTSVQVLDGIGPAVWDALCAGHGADGIVDAAIAEFGVPPEGDARTIVQSTLDQFVGAGILKPTSGGLPEDG
ncbi:PqqD family protein [Microbacterium sp. H1-D42]|uniref:PqqD family protein n=1 Tax=Microbacterium sp. H1-D42 TaxID=2925844 RepID=UPI001F5381A6|nr:PqqD family protein [Microbacterium sp. H1-D42]UNK70123.1 hypothetical protein MNR00_13260 [Microbacterium sp. H1-D42]